MKKLTFSLGVTRMKRITTENIAGTGLVGRLEDKVSGVKTQVLMCKEGDGQNTGWENDEEGANRQIERGGTERRTEWGWHD